MAPQELIDTANIRCRWQDHATTGECLFDCFDPVIDIGPVCRFVARDERILAPLRALYDDEAYLLQGQADFQAARRQGLCLAPGLH